MTRTSARQQTDNLAALVEFLIEEDREIERRRCGLPSGATSPIRRRRGQRSIKRIRQSRSASPCWPATGREERRLTVDAGELRL
jgi:hypothetical protein